MITKVWAAIRSGWEKDLEVRYELEKQKIFDSYKETDLEFRNWLLELLLEEVKSEDGYYECDSDDPLYDDWVYGGEPIRAEQSETDGAEIDPGYAGEIFSEPESVVNVTVCVREDGGEDRFLFPVMEIETTETTDNLEAETYEDFYAEIDAYKMQNKGRSKKKHYKYRPRKS